MNLRYFAHSWRSDWNHGNAHFLRGLMSALARRGHQIRCYERADGWSYRNLLSEPGGAESARRALAAYPDLNLELYRERLPDLAGADVVVVHEWNEPELFTSLLEARRRFGFRLLLHDTHHRALSEAAMLDRLPIAAFDAVLAFGESLRRLYEARGARRTYTYHEAADTERFAPDLARGAASPGRLDLLWVGNWGDEERTAELEEYFIGPVARLGMRAAAYGIRYPEAAQRRLAAAGIAYRGYLPNLEVPAAYATAAMAVHVPRQYYTQGLEGIPTIRVFEALACGMPLLSAPWRDSEGLFQPGRDFLMASDGREMAALMVQLARDEAQRTQLGLCGLATVRARHTCAHRAEQLEEICHDLDCTCSYSVPA